MEQQLRVGARLESATCTTEVIVVKAPLGPVDLRCGGAPMGEGAVAGSRDLDETQNKGTALGKRYVDDDSGTELLAVKAGVGSLSIDGRPLGLKGAKPLPASD